MKDVPIVNKDVLAALDNFLWYYDNKDLVAKTLRLHGEAKDREHYVSTKHRDTIVKEDEKHEGFPEESHAYALKAERLHFNDDHDKIEAAQFYSNYSKFNQELCTLLSTRNNALTQLYPPNGYISWHNNANASAYNIIFSWSETGEGCFRYIDGHTGKEVVIPDKKGWQCKAGYFGAYGEPWYNRVYHAAETDCWRITVSYMFDRSDMGLGLQDDIVEEIMSDF
jgi:hypothetical protein|tara:strand:+ start:838 stop:1509 length:672 start_codon:yes stop_codon:yes gene_type:complete